MAGVKGNSGKTTASHSSEHVKLRRWSATKLREAGFTPEQVEELLDLRVDYRYAVRLTSTGCDHETFMRIIR